MQLEQRLKESATAFFVGVFGHRKKSIFHLCFESQTKNTTNHIFQHMKPNHWFMFDVLFAFIFFPSLSSVQSFPILSALLIVVSGVLLPELHGAQTSRSVTWSWDVSSFGQLGIPFGQLCCWIFQASWEWNMSKCCWSFKSWRMGMDACYLNLFNTSTGIGRNEQAWVRRCWIFCWHDLWQYPFWNTWTKTVSIDNRLSGWFGSSRAHWIWRCSFSLRPCAYKLGSHQVLFPPSPFFSYICSFLITHVSTYLVVIIYHTAIALAIKGSARESSAGKSSWYSISFAICPSIPVFQTEV